MGTPSGIRTRKYHGFCLSIPGREEKAFLADLEFSLNGKAIWPHAYADGVIDHPEQARACGEAFSLSEEGWPLWVWKLEGGSLRFSVRSPGTGVLALHWEWAGERAACLKVRPFFAMRPLHALGGRQWELRPARGGALEAGEAGAAETGEIIPFRWETPTGREPRWLEEPLWYYRFFYSEEVNRGYDAHEDLFTAGYWEIEVEGAAEFRLGRPSPRSRAARRHGPAWDFVLEDPPGVCAGFPWFGEWGRDTFISLPGLVAGRIRSGEPDEKALDWAEAVLARWGRWIESDGMIPNLLEGESGRPQWESCDATLWWAHSLAALWAMFLSKKKLCARIQERFAPLLDQAALSIHEGRHRFLSLEADGTLSVTGEHSSCSSWMDARVEGKAVTPRTGRLPEINALWFQERCLQAIWKSEASSSELRDRAEVAMSCQESGRPNEIFHFSLPLAPAFVARALGANPAYGLSRFTDLVTPCGMRTLSPSAPDFQSAYAGSQRLRDAAYHRGLVWPWLGGHEEMARDRFDGSPEREEATCETPIRGHVPELYEPLPPYEWRGTPAQAWSLACAEEARDRRERRTDRKLNALLKGIQ